MWTASHFQSVMFSFVLQQSFIEIFQGYYSFVSKHKKKYKAEEEEDFTHVFWSQTNLTPWCSNQSRDKRHISAKCLRGEKIRDVQQNASIREK